MCRLAAAETAKHPTDLARQGTTKAYKTRAEVEKISDQKQKDLHQAFLSPILASQQSKQHKATLHIEISKHQGQNQDFVLGAKK